MAFFKLEEFGVWRGTTQVVKQVSFTLSPGEVLALEGSNGAGKTTLLEGIAGLHATRGGIWLGGKTLPPSGVTGRAAQGISLCPDGRHLFTDMTVLENLTLGAYSAGLRAGQQRIQGMLDSVPWLRDRLHQRAGTLSGGEQQLVALCRALMAAPDLLLLDSPTSGLAPAFRARVTDVVKQFIAGGDRAVIVADDDTVFVDGLASARASMKGGHVAMTVAKS